MRISQGLRIQCDGDPVNSRMSRLYVASLGFAFMAMPIAANATTFTYVLEGEYGTESDTSASVRGGQFRVSAEFTAADLLASNAFSATYRNGGVSIVTTGTANDVNQFFPIPAQVLVQENPDAFNDRMTVSMPVMVDFTPDSGGGIDPLFITAPYIVEFTDESVVSGSPPGLPAFDETNAIFSFLPGLLNVASCETLVHVSDVPEPSTWSLLILGGAAFLFCCHRARRVRGVSS